MENSYRISQTGSSGKKLKTGFHNSIIKAESELKDLKIKDSIIGKRRRL